MNKFLSGIFKWTRSVKLDVEEYPHIEGFVKPNIQEKYTLTTKTSPLYYADVLLPLKKNMNGENRCCPLSNCHSGKIRRQNFQDQKKMYLLSGIQTLQYTVDTLSCGYLHIPHAISITKSRN